MTLNYIAFTSTGHPVSVNSFVITKNSWKVYLLCDTNFPNYCYFYDDAKSLKSDIDKNKVPVAMFNLGQACESGIPLKNVYNEKKCHEAITFTFENKDIDIWRIRQGHIRIYFIYLPPTKRIVILGMRAKRTGDISTKDKKHFKSLATAVLEDDLSTFDKRVKRVQNAKPKGA